MSIYCIAPWAHGFVHADGSIRPCCVSTEVLGNTQKGDTVTSVWNEDSYKRLRNTLLSGEIPDSCSSCPRQERASAIPRKKMLEDQFADSVELRKRIETERPITFDSSEIRTLDLSFGKLCNLRCRFCGPLFSSSWVSDAKELLAKDNKYWSQLGYQADSEYNRNPPSYIDTINNIVDFSSIEFIEIKGGEPFLSKEFPIFLEEICRQGIASRIKIHFTSNLTIVNNDVLNLLKNFKRVSCNVSIDATGPLYQYLRGESYTLESDIYRNLLKLDQTEKIFININSVLSVMNVLNMLEVSKWYESLQLKRLQRWIFRPIAWPEPLGLKNLPPEMVELAINRLNSSSNENIQKIILILKKYLHHTPCDTPSMVKYIDEIDQVRRTNFLDLAPEFESVFQSCRNSIKTKSLPG